MRDDASLQRLAEMGFAVYAPRALRSANGAAPTRPSAATTTVSREARAGSRARVVLLARPGTAAARTLLDGIRRALAFAGLDGFVESAVDSRIGDAAGLVAFGEAMTREAGVTLPTPRQNALQWVSAADVAAIGGNPQAKRRLWSELKRIARALRSGAQA